MAIAHNEAVIEMIKTIEYPITEFTYKAQRYDGVREQEISVACTVGRLELITEPVDPNEVVGFGPSAGSSAKDLIDSGHLSPAVTKFADEWPDLEAKPFCAEVTWPEGDVLKVGGYTIPDLFGRYKDQRVGLRMGSGGDLDTAVWHCTNTTLNLYKGRITIEGGTVCIDALELNERISRTAGVYIAIQVVDAGAVADGTS